MEQLESFERALAAEECTMEIYAFDIDTLNVFRWTGKRSELAYPAIRSGLWIC
jgi:hypothetical protein